MLTALQFQVFNKTGNAVSPATCIETLYFEQSYNGQVYRTSLNNRLLVTGNKLNTVNKQNIMDALNRAELPFYYITKLKSDTASGLYRLDVSLVSINTAVRNTTVVNELWKELYDTSTEIYETINDVSNALGNYQNAANSTYVKKKGDNMTGGIVFGNVSSPNEYKDKPGIAYNGENLIIACPSNGYISLWGSISLEFGMNTPGITIKYPTVSDNGKVLVYNYSSSLLVWSQYNAGSLLYSTADYLKYYILGITQDSYESRAVNESKFIATEGNIETNVYVHRKNIYANAFYQTSDIEFKTDITDIDNNTYIPRVVLFKWLDTSLPSYGFIAQDLEEHNLEYLMDKDDNDNWRVNYSATLSLVVGDLLNKVDDLILLNTDLLNDIKNIKSENNDLKNIINELTKRIEKLENGTR